MSVMDEELYHYGVLGMKWGVRRYQNTDGTLTDLGKKHLSKDVDRFNRLEKDYNKKSANLAKRQQKFQKVAKRPTITDTDLELKRRQGAKLSKAYRSYVKSGERFVKTYDWMKDVYGLDNLSSYQIDKGRTYTAELLKNKGAI